MSVPVTVLIFVVIPLGVCALAAAAVYGPSATRTPRYRPGRPWNYQPVWFLPHEHHSVLARVTHQQEQEGAPLGVPAAKTGGASGEW